MKDSLSLVCRYGVLLLALIVTGCAAVPQQASDEIYDPLEKVNRGIFKVNLAVDRAVVKPVAKGYRKLVPQYPRDRFRSFVNNLMEPRIFINDLLQVRLNSAGITFARFLMNSTFGVLGLWDRASEHNLPRQSGDFGQTLYMWGVSEGPYLVLPFFGPSNVRDAAGFGVDLYTEALTNPIQDVFSEQDRDWVNLGLGIGAGIDLRERNIETLDAVESTSIDFYSQLRSIWLQHRRAELRKARGIEDGPTQLIDPDAPEK